jgi:hypothetical protein
LDEKYPIKTRQSGSLTPILMKGFNNLLKRRCRGWVPARFYLSAGAYPRESSFCFGNTFIKIGSYDAE